jgi:hypothetical protein
MADSNRYITMETVRQEKNELPARMNRGRRAVKQAKF